MYLFTQSGRYIQWTFYYPFFQKYKTRCVIDFTSSYDFLLWTSTSSHFHPFIMFVYLFNSAKLFHCKSKNELHKFNKFSQIIKNL